MPSEHAIKYRETARRSYREYLRKQRERTRLEHAAFLARKDLPEGYQPYTERERVRMEAIRAQMELLPKLAEELQLEIVGRLGRSSRPEDARLLERFLDQKPVRIELKPF